MRQLDWRQIGGWIAVSISIVVTCLWACWGIIENFHEGWYYQSWLSNLGLMIVQYLSPMIVFMALTLISIVWPRFGALMYGVLALFAVGFFQAFTNTVVFLLIVPLIGIGLLYWFGRPQPQKLALFLSAGLPLLTLVLCGAGPAWRVLQRFDDGNLQARLVSGNGVTLMWAPDGPGWPRLGASWFEAQQTCHYLTEDGLTKALEAQQIWRLPTVDEVVRSMTRHDRNSGGIWDPDIAEASYETPPDKESPLWNMRSQVIYWWTATEVDEDNAYIIVYDGKVWPRAKELNLGYLGFRCVKQPDRPRGLSR